MGKYLLGLLLIPSAVSSQQSLSTMSMSVTCAPTPIVVEAVKKYSESVIFFGKNDSGHTVSLWYNPETKSFTVLKGTKGGEYSCVIADGIKQDNI